MAMDLPRCGLGFELGDVRDLAPRESAQRREGRVHRRLSPEHQQLVALEGFQQGFSPRLSLAAGLHRSPPGTNGPEKSLGRPLVLRTLRRLEVLDGRGPAFLEEDLAAQVLPAAGKQPWIFALLPVEFFQKPFIRSWGRG